MSENERPPAAEYRSDGTTSASWATTAAWPVHCADFRASAEFRLEPHTHDEPHVCFVLGGGLLERVGRGWRPMHTGSARLSPAGDAHDLVVTGEPLRCLIVAIDAEFLDASDGPTPDARRYVAGPGVEDLSRRLLAELDARDDTSPLSLEMLGLEAAALARGRTREVPVEPPPPWLQRVRERVCDDLRSIPTLDELARDAGVSRAHLARTFRARFGCTIGRYARNRRIETARHLILASDRPLASVAFEAGFADQSHMTRQVSARFGRPPGRLRAVARST